jgi:hypothetical protein
VVPRDYPVARRKTAKASADGRYDARDLVSKNRAGRDGVFYDFIKVRPADAAGPDFDDDFAGTGFRIASIGKGETVGRLAVNPEER